MVWKQDLAKLKAQLREEPAPPPPKKVAPVGPLTPPRSMEEEDALFLAMMGHKAPRPNPPAAAPAPAQTPAPKASEAVEDFGSALAGLKGMRPLAADPVRAVANREAAPKPLPEPKPVVAEAVAPPSAPEPPAPALRPEAVPEAAGGAGPLRIQLAAGMAVEVDGTLDLRGHSLQDALERLKDRAADARYLHWRSLLVQLGAEPALHEGFLALMGQGGLPGVLRFAQAPVPMGGPQAWILYLHP